MLRQPRPSVFNGVPFTFPFTGKSYAQRILNTQPASLIALWGLGEASGTTAANAEGTTARDGTYLNGVTLNAATFSDGTPAPSFDGSDDGVNVYSSSISSAFNHDEGTQFCWLKVSGAGVWSDGVTRYLMNFRLDFNNRIYMDKTGGLNALQFVYLAGGVLIGVTVPDAAGSTGWIPIAMTWSKAADEMKGYINGVQVGTTQTGLPTWAGSGLASSNTCLAALNTTGANSWNGYMKYATVWNKPLTASEIAALSTV